MIVVLPLHVIFLSESKALPWPLAPLFWCMFSFVAGKMSEPGRAMSRQLPYSPEQHKYRSGSRKVAIAEPGIFTSHFHIATHPLYLFTLASASLPSAEAIGLGFVRP